MLTNTIAYFRHRPSRSIGFLFAVGSLLLGIWVAALPGIKERLELSDGTLGLSLLLAPLGSLAGVAVSPYIFSRFGAGRYWLAGCFLQCLMYISQVMAVNRPMFWAALFGTGFLGCLNGIASNAIVDSTEKKTSRKIMSTSHAMYSIGGGVSAGIAALLNNFQVPAPYQIVAMSVAIWFGLLLVRKEILHHNEPIHSGPAFSAPPRTVAGLAFICFVTFMGEGCIADWSAIYIHESLKSSLALASLGYAGFSVMMAFGRLNGDRLSASFPAVKIVKTGLLVAATGFVLVVFVPFSWAAITGFTLAGLGFSCIVPLLFSSAANIPDISPVMGIASVATGGLIGFLTGPALIGFISERISLGWGLSIMLLLCLGAFVTAGRNRFPTPQNAKIA